MDWLQSLLWDPSSVAHIVFLYAFVVAGGGGFGERKKIGGFFLPFGLAVAGPADPIGRPSRAGDGPM